MRVQSEGHATAERSVDTPPRPLAICPDDLVTAPVYEVGPVMINGLGDSWNNDFWKVAGITWNGFNCVVNPINQTVTATQASNSP